LTPGEDRHNAAADAAVERRAGALCGLRRRIVDRSAQVALDQRLLAQAALAAGSIDQGKARLDADLPRAQLPGFALAVYKNGRVVQVAGAAPSPVPADRGFCIGRTRE
jgi:hypothetical protein